MKVLFTQDVPKVGKRFEIKEVANGYASNYLFPRKLAEPATEKAAARVEAYKRRHDEEEKLREELLAKSLIELGDISITMHAAANEQGHLFAGIHREEILRALSDSTRLTFTEKNIALEHPIKTAGVYNIPLAISTHKGSIKITVIGEQKKANP